MTLTVTPMLVHTPVGPLEYVTEGQGPAVLAVHGAMGGYDQSLLLARTIGAPDFRSYAVSRPGYLGTPLSSGKSPEAQADLFAAALDTWGVARVGVMAISGGGPAAIHFALRHPQRCWGLVLVSTCTAKVTEKIPMGFRLLKHAARWPWLLTRMIPKAASDPELGAARSIPDPELRARTLADPETGPLFRALQASTWDRMAERIDGTFNDIAISRACDYPLEQIAVPTLIVHGSADRMVSFDQHARPAARRIRGAELVVAEGGDHVSIYTHRREVLPRVHTFLRAHAQG